MNYAEVRFRGCTHTYVGYPKHIHTWLRRLKEEFPDLDELTMVLRWSRISKWRWGEENDSGTLFLPGRRYVIIGHDVSARSNFIRPPPSADE